MITIPIIKILSDILPRSNSAGNCAIIANGKIYRNINDIAFPNILVG